MQVSAVSRTTQGSRCTQTRCRQKPSRTQNLYGNTPTSLSFDRLSSAPTLEPGKHYPTLTQMILNAFKCHDIAQDDPR